MTSFTEPIPETSIFCRPSIEGWHMGDGEFSNGAMLFSAVRDVAGEDGIRDLQRCFGGEEIFVPGRRASERSALTRALGFDLATRIVDKLRVIGADGRVAAGFRVYIPIGQPSVYRAARTAAIEALTKGATPAEVVDDVGLCIRTLYRIRNDLGLK